MKGDFSASLSSSDEDSSLKTTGDFRKFFSNSGENRRPADVFSVGSGVIHIAEFVAVNKLLSP